MEIACVILNYNDSERVITLVKKIYTFSMFTKIIIVDNNSKKNDYEILKKMENGIIKVLKTNDNLGFSGGNNYGFRFLEKINPKYVFTMNSDIDVSKENLNSLINFLENHNDISICSGQMIENNKERQCFYDFPTIKHYIMDNLGLVKIFKISPKNKLDMDGYSYVDYIRSSLWCIRYEDFKKVDYFDINTFLYHVETCVGLKLKKIGKKFAIVDGVIYFHNHIYKDGYKILGYKDSYKSLNYIFREYLNKNRISLFMYRCSFYIGLFIRKLAKIR